MPYVRYVTRYIILCLVCGWGVLSGGASAAPLTLSNVPLSLTVKAPPNILFVLDDSAIDDHKKIRGTDPKEGLDK